MRIYFNLKSNYLSKTKINISKKYKKTPTSTAGDCNSGPEVLDGLESDRGDGWPPGRAAQKKDESVGKPGSVVDDHSSATGVTTCL